MHLAGGLSNPWVDGGDLNEFARSRHGARARAVSREDLGEAALLREYSGVSGGMSGGVPHEQRRLAHGQQIYAWGEH